MLLSIITINLNNKDGLRKTIDSVTSQIRPDVEYIIIDGKSTDGSVDVIREYSENINYWVSESDSGIYNAMNKGILRSTGKYCLFLNSGDYLVDNILNILPVSQFSDEIIYGNVILTHKDGTRTRRFGAGRSKLTFYDFYAGSSINHQAAFINRNLFNQYGLYDESFKITSDWFFFAKVIIINNVTVKYIDLDIAYFDPYGISTASEDQNREEGKAMMAMLLPSGILDDYGFFKLTFEENDGLRTELRRYKHRFGKIDYILNKIKKLVSVY